MDRKFVMTGMGYGIVGLLLGIHMAASHNHGQMVTHAHIMLLGFVVSFVYGVCHKLWLNNIRTRLALTQYYLHQVGTLLLLAGLFLLYGRFIDATKIEPVLSIGSMLVLAGFVLMKVLFIKSARSA